ncbi:MAG: hypothetical protein ACTSX7_15560 [Alphaproteobacteria bacterium]
MSFSRTIYGLALLLLAACQPLPQPFSHTGSPDNVLLQLPDHVGVVVLPVAEAPPTTAQALAQAMVSALHAANVPATTSGGARASRFLQGRVEDDGSDAGLIWELFAADGTSIGEFRHSIEGTPLAAWRDGEPTLMQNLAWIGAGPVAALLQPQTAQSPVLLHLASATVSGAPGLGDTHLQRAILAALEVRGVRIGVPTPAGVKSILQGKVLVTPAKDGTQQVRITWLILGADGTEHGTVAQENAVPAGSLDGSWAAVAPLIAVAAAPGIIEVLTRNNQSAKSAVTNQP